MPRSYWLLSFGVLATVTGCQTPAWDPASAPRLSNPSGLHEIRLIAKGIE